MWPFSVICPLCVYKAISMPKFFYPLFKRVTIPGPFPAGKTSRAQDPAGGEPDRNFVDFPLKKGLEPKYLCRNIYCGKRLEGIIS